MKKVSSILVIATVLLGSAAYAAFPEISVWPESAWFCTVQPVPVGEGRTAFAPVRNSITKPFTIVNRGDADLLVSGVEVRSTTPTTENQVLWVVLGAAPPADQPPDGFDVFETPPPNPFSLPPPFTGITTCIDELGNPVPIVPGGSCTIYATFKTGHDAALNSIRNIKARLAIHSNDPSRPQESVTLFGNPPGCTAPSGSVRSPVAGQFVGVPENAGNQFLREKVTYITCNCRGTSQSCGGPGSPSVDGAGAVKCWSTSTCIGCCFSYLDWLCGQLAD